MLALNTLAKRIFGTTNDRRLKSFSARIPRINALEPEIANRLTSDLHPLHQAIRSKQPGIARLLLDRGASLDASETSGGVTARELAEKAGLLAELGPN